MRTALTQSRRPHFLGNHIEYAEPDWLLAARRFNFVQNRSIRSVRSLRIASLARS
jgi:hypothetical protein